MLSSITPLGERGRGNRWAITATAFAVGAVVGGAAIGSALGAIGHVVLVALPADPVPTWVRLLLLAAAAALGALADLGRLGLRIPSLRRQVDEGWIGRYRGWVYGAGFGLQLGVGVVTVVTSAATWVALVAMALTGAPPAGAALGLLFGTARAAPLVQVRSVRTTADLRHLHERNARRAGAASRAAVGGQAGFVIVCAICAVLIGPWS